MITFKISSDTLWIRMIFFWSVTIQRDDKTSAYTFAKLAYEKNNYYDLGQFSDITKNIGEIHYIRCLYNTSYYYDCDNMLYKILNDNRNNYTEMELKEAQELYDNIMKDKSKRERVL